MATSNYNVQMLPRAAGGDTLFNALAHPPRSAEGAAHLVARDAGDSFAHPPRSAQGSAHLIARDVTFDFAHPPRAAQGDKHLVARDENVDFAHPPRSAQGGKHIVARGENVDFAHPPRSAQGGKHIVARDEDFDFAHPPRSAQGEKHIIARDLDDQFDGAIGLAARQIGISPNQDTAAPVQRRSDTGKRSRKHRRGHSESSRMRQDLFGGLYNGSALEKGAMAGLTFSSASVATAKASASATETHMRWSNGDIGIMYSRQENGTLTVLTDASNVFVVEGGGDTSNGDPLKAKIVTRESKNMTAHFWLIDTTGNFCDNEGGEEGQDNCYITLGEGYNQAPYSLVPYDLEENNGTVPDAMWSINQKTGVLRGHRNGHHEVAFTKNENEAGNGDIDAYDSKDSLDEGYVAVDLLLRRR